MAVLTERSWAQDFRLAVVLAVRELKGRYSRSALGLAWIVIWPLCLLSIYYFVFSVIAKLNWLHPITGQKVPYVIPLFCGIATFLWFSDAITGAVHVFVRNANFVQRSTAPLWVIWLSGLLRACPGGIASFALILILNAVLIGASPTMFIALPVALIIFIAFLSALTLLFAAIGPFVGDMDDAIRVVLRIGFYAAPVTYPLDHVSGKYAWLYYLNPITPFVELNRNAVLTGGLMTASDIIICLAWICVTTAAALFVYGRAKDAVVDVL